MTTKKKKRSTDEKVTFFAAKATDRLTIRMSPELIARANACCEKAGLIRTDAAGDYLPDTSVAVRAAVYMWCELIEATPKPSLARALAGSGR